MHRRCTLFLLTCFLCTSCACLAADLPAGVHYLPAANAWALSTSNSTYIVGVNKKAELMQLYWGRRLQREDDVTRAPDGGAYAFESAEGISPEEYPGWGGMRYAEPCLKVTLDNGVRDLVLHYLSYEAKADSLDIRLKDIQYDLFVRLHYEVYPASGIISKRATIENRTGQPVTLESAQSGVWYLPPGGAYRLSYLHGRWGAETQLVREAIHPGVKVLESRRGNTSHQMNPWFAIDAGGAASEEHGRVWFGAVAWSGNWRIAVEQTPNERVRVTGGYNTFDFSYLLKPGETLDTPAFYAGFTTGGFGEASRLMHRFERTELAPDRAAPRVRPVLYNSWEATEFNVNEEGQKALADKAARIGAERFVMDDGWFGARNNDRAGLGDWYVNKQKFPNGLKPLIDHVKQLGMDFGLWVEPEMVNANSDLYRAHPDWVINFPGRPRTEGRNQMVLNMARDDVKEYILNVLDRLLAENDIRFIKWDMNRHITEPGWPEVAPSEQRHLWVKYVTNVYDIFDRLREKHPKVEIEACSGGGGRVDLGILRRVDQFWTSDNTDAFDRLRIQEGFSYAYAPKVMMAWVTDVPHWMDGRTVSLHYRFLSAMQGSLGVGGNLNKWTDADVAEAAKMVAFYKTIRGTVQQGELYRLAPPRAGELTVNQYLAADGKQAVVFALLHSQQFGAQPPAIVLRGLDEKALYRVKPLDANKLGGARDAVSGAYLMGNGLGFRLRGDYDATAVVLERVD